MHVSRIDSLSGKIIIAIVDDDESLREALIGLMDSLDYSAIGFASAEDFLKSDRRRDASCLIADVQMPEMSGLELLQRLAAAGEGLPTILITAYPDPKTRHGALQAGVTCYLAKPFREDELLSCIERAIGSPDATA